MLRKPSLAVRWPNGMIAANDDYGERVIVIDPRTKRIVWQYGHTGVPSSARGYLDKPDGIDLLPAPAVAASKPPPRLVASASVRVKRVGSLPAAASRLAATVLPDGRLMVLGGLVDGASSTQILAGRPPTATHDAAAVTLGRAVYLLGGGQAGSSDAVVRVSAAGRAVRVGSLGE